MIGVEERHDMIGGDKWRSPKHHRDSIEFCRCGGYFFQVLLCSWRMRAYMMKALSKLMM